MYPSSSTGRDARMNAVLLLAAGVAIGQLNTRSG
jgi:hypothetical protein